MKNYHDCYYHFSDQEKKKYCRTNFPNLQEICWLNLQAYESISERKAYVRFLDTETEPQRQY